MRENHFFNLPQSLPSNSFLFEKLLFKISKKWIAGYNINDAINYAMNANERGIKSIINYLGEDFKNENYVKNTVTEYKNIIDKMRIANIQGSISIKPSQIGLAINTNFCSTQLKEIFSAAKKNQIFIWLDMESFQNVEPTLSLYQGMLKETKEIGIVLQSYLKRSHSDMTKLLKCNANIRLVKGAYHESKEHAFQRKPEIDNNYYEMLQLFFNTDLIENQFLAIATHDSSLIQKSLHLFSISNLKKEILHFQFLKGIREKLKIELLTKGFNVEEYIPYGENWLPYSMRRIKEKKSNIFLLMRSLISS